MSLWFEGQVPETYTYTENYNNNVRSGMGIGRTWWNTADSKGKICRQSQFLEMKGIRR